MNRPRVKYCGITRLEDALLASDLGVDALGFVFYEHSPRAISPAAAAEIIAALPAFVSSVGLFVDASAADITAVIETTKIDLLQFHGSERAEYCSSAARPYIKALKVRDANSLRDEARWHSAARGILIDSYVPGVAGGTGQTFDWNDVPGDFEQPLIIAGGLTVDNVGAAIERFQPYGVDVSTGIEAAYGIKDEAKMRDFMTEVNRHYGQR